MRKAKESFLSCNEKESGCFLSCTLSQHNNNLSTSNRNLQRFSAEKISCVSSRSSESVIKSDLFYRANNKKSLIVGIDPGITGAIAIIKTGAKPAFVTVFDMPVYKNNKGKNRVDFETFSFLIESYSKDIILALVEEVGQIGTNADPFSSFVFGFATGGVHGVLAAHAIKTHVVHPITWKNSLGLDADKAKSVSKALKFFPESQKHLTRKKDHGRAEALLIAYWANQFVRRAA